MEVQLVDKNLGNDSKYLLEARKKALEQQGYRLVGSHSAIKTCHYCSASIKGKSVCYKNTFYGIKSWQCIQATVTLDFCNLRCQWCWRDISYTFPKNTAFNDDPKDIFEGFIREHEKAVIGYVGSKNADKKRALEALKPKHVALSLTGDACMYQRLPELIDAINANNMTSFLVTNGTFPSMVKKLTEHQPTQIYVTLPAPDEETYLKATNPMAKDGWNKIEKSLRLLKNFDRSVVRLTLAKGMNFHNPKGYSEMLRDIDVDFIELKSAMPIGYASYRMSREQMPSHEEIKDFASEIAKQTDYKLTDEKKESRVVLLMNPGNKKRYLAL